MDKLNVGETYKIKIERKLLSSEKDDIIFEDIESKYVENYQTPNEVLQTYKYKFLQNGITNFDNILASVHFDEIIFKKCDKIEYPFFDENDSFEKLFDNLLTSKCHKSLLYLYDDCKMKKINSIDKEKIVSEHTEISFEDFQTYSPSSGDEIECIKCFIFIRLNKFISCFEDNYIKNNNEELKEYYTQQLVNFIVNIKESTFTIYDMDEYIVIKIDYNYVCFGFSFE